MVDLTGIKGTFIFCFVFVGVFALIMGLGISDIPNLFAEATTYSYVEPPDYFTSANVEDLATFYNITADNAGAYYSEAWGIDEGFGHHFFFQASVVGGEVKIANQHYHVLWLIVELPTGHHDMEWIDATNGTNYGDYITQSIFDDAKDYDASTQVSRAYFRVKCEHVYLHATVAFNETEHIDITDAFQADEMTVMFAIDWDELGTGLNAYSLISQLMTFQKPDIHPALNALIALPLWAMFGFIVVVVILAIIEALPFT